MTSSSSSAHPRRGSERLWARLAAIAGVVTLSVIVAFQSLPEVTAAGDCVNGEAVIRFEIARTSDDLEAVFGPADGACRAKVIAAMDAVNTLDVWLFIPAYTAFVSFAALFLAGGGSPAANPAAPGRRVAVWAAIGAAGVALAADYAETFALLAYTPDLAPTPPMLARSSTAASVKFAALALNGLALAALCFTPLPARRWALGGLLCLPAIGVGLMFADARWAAAQSICFLAAWIPLCAIAISAATRRAS